MNHELGYRMADVEGFCSERPLQEGRLLVVSLPYSSHTTVTSPRELIWPYGSSREATHLKATLLNTEYGFYPGSYTS